MHQNVRSGRRKAMQYLGRIAGTGQLQIDATPMGPASYDFEGFFKPAGGVACAGEIEAPTAVLQGLLGQRNVRLVTKSGLTLELRLSAKKLGPTARVAHVDVSGDLPTEAAAWRAVGDDD